ncbi:MAG TPA: hypothetical protein VN702_11975, partial [Acetobacteraceae bacterium]|nr:hypothetical protein [Acetobacteraceae bacterium]
MRATVAKSLGAVAFSRAAERAGGRPLSLALRLEILSGRPFRTGGTGLRALDIRPLPLARLLPGSGRVRPAARVQIRPIGRVEALCVRAARTVHQIARDADIAPPHGVGGQ